MSSAGGRQILVQRASQLDAERLDEELSTLFEGSAASCLRFFPAPLVELYAPEMRVLFRLFFFANTIAMHVPTPGNEFQNLRYITDLPSRRVHEKFGGEGLPLTRAQRVLYLLLQVLLPYGWERLRLFATYDGWTYDLPGTWRHSLWRAMNRAEAISRAISLANFCAFLRNGRYRSLSDRILRMRLVYSDVAATRRPSFEFLNRQLVWQGVAEFLLYLSPIVTTGQLSRMLTRSRIGRRLLGSFARPGVRRAPLPGQAAVEGHEWCVGCGDGKATMPHRALPCRHRFCYVCIAGALEKDPTLRCAACHRAVLSFERVKFG